MEMTEFNLPTSTSDYTIIRKVRRFLMIVARASAHVRVIVGDYLDAVADPLSDG
jgi:hypothetical protein